MVQPDGAEEIKLGLFPLLGWNYLKGKTFSHKKRVHLSYIILHLSQAQTSVGVLVCVCTISGYTLVEAWRNQVINSL